MVHFVWISTGAWKYLYYFLEWMYQCRNMLSVLSVILNMTQGWFLSCRNGVFLGFLGWNSTSSPPPALSPHPDLRPIFLPGTAQVFVPCSLSFVCVSPKALQSIFPSWRSCWWLQLSARAAGCGWGWAPQQELPQQARPVQVCSTAH